MRLGGEESKKRVSQADEARSDEQLVGGHVGPVARGRQHLGMAPVSCCIGLDLAPIISIAYVIGRPVAQVLAGLDARRLMNSMIAEPGRQSSSMSSALERWASRLRTGHVLIRLIVLQLLALVGID